MMIALRQRVPEKILKWIFAAVLILAGVSYVIWERTQEAQARRELAVELLEQARLLIVVRI